MNVIIDRSFERDINKITERKLLIKVADCIEFTKEVRNQEEIKGIKKLKGAPFHYRIRIR